MSYLQDNRPLFTLTVDEFKELQKQSASTVNNPCYVAAPEKQYVYGIAGLARLFGCSKPTANRIKASGRIDAAITQIGRKIIVDAELALELAGKKKGGRK